MLERLKDKVPEIRSQAVTALQRLQDPKDDECPIIKVSPTKPENHALEIRKAAFFRSRKTARET
jgi:condensin complex subunit 3